jgi:hypothetical protein
MLKKACTYSLFHRKMYIHLLVLTYIFGISFATVINESAQYRLLTLQTEC